MLPNSHQIAIKNWYQIAAKHPYHTIATKLFLPCYHKIGTLKLHFLGGKVLGVQNGNFLVFWWQSCRNLLVVCWQCGGYSGGNLVSKLVTIWWHLLRFQTGSENSNPAGLYSVYPKSQKIKSWKRRFEFWQNLRPSLYVQPTRFSANFNFFIYPYPSLTWDQGWTTIHICYNGFSSEKRLGKSNWKKPIWGDSKNFLKQTILKIS